MVGGVKSNVYLFRSKKSLQYMSSKCLDRIQYPQRSSNEMLMTQEGQPATIARLPVDSVRIGLPFRLHCFIIVTGDSNDECTIKYIIVQHSRTGLQRAKQAAFVFVLCSELPGCYRRKDFQ